MRLTRRAALFTAVALTLATPAMAKQKSADTWVTVWTSAQMTPGPDTALTPDAAGATLRQTVHIARGGKSLRLRLSNAMGADPLRLDTLRIALAPATGAAQVDPATQQAVTFGGLSDILIPAGADYISDPIALTVPDGGDLAITFHIPDAPKRQTGHPGSRTTSWLTAGEATADLTGATHFDRWFHIAAVDIQGGSAGHAVIMFGDSITDGYGITPNSNHRFPDFLALRLKDRPVAVLNAGIGGNRLLLDGSGPNALARFDRDVLSQSGVKAVIVLEGINDLGMLTKDAPVSAAEHADLVARIKAAYLQMIYRAHSHGLKIYGGTIMPYMGMDFYHPEPVSEADRQAINTWIRESGAFDGVIDFDAALRDPSRPDHLLPLYDSGDHIHPSEAGYKAMADAIDLKWLE